MRSTEAAPARALERRYQRLLLAYPPRYRRHRGDEIVGTLLEAAVPGRHWPRPAEATDLLAGGLRRRFGLHAVRGADQGLVLAGAAALAIAAGLSVFLWLHCEFVTGADERTAPPHTPVPPHFGPFLTLGPVAYLAWLAAALGRCLLPRWLGRPVIAGALLLTGGLPVLAGWTGYDRPPSAVLLGLGLFGALALIGYPNRHDNRDRAITGLGTSGVFALAAVPVLATFSGHDPMAGYRSEWSWQGGTIALALGVLLVGGTLWRLFRAGVGEWVWAGWLLLVPGSATVVAAEPAVGILDIRQHRQLVQGLFVLAVALFVLAVALAVLAVVLLVAHRRATTDRRSAGGRPEVAPGRVQRRGRDRQPVGSLGGRPGGQ